MGGTTPLTRNPSTARSATINRLPDSELVRVCGDILRAEPEQAQSAGQVDHFWITLDCGVADPVQLSINTLSLRSLHAGFDPRLRVARVRRKIAHLPSRGVRVMERFDYSEFESTHNAFFETLGREEIDQLFIELSREMPRVSAWGSPYSRKAAPGLHQIHSRRRSDAVPQDVVGCDGGIEFHATHGPPFDVVMVMMKFSGQP